MNGVPPLLAVLPGLQHALGHHPVFVLEILLDCGRRCWRRLGVRLLWVASVVLSRQPFLIPLWLQPLYKGLHGDLHGVWPAVAPRRPLPVLHPPLRREVCRLGDVEARVEAGVITQRERDHDLSFLLHDLVVWNGVLPEEIRRDEAHLVTEEGRTILEQ